MRPAFAVLLFVTLALHVADLAAFYRHVRAGAESGWDYSTRWFDDGCAPCCSFIALALLDQHKTTNPALQRLDADDLHDGHPARRPQLSAAARRAHARSVRDFGAVHFYFIYFCFFFRFAALQRLVGRLLLNGSHARVHCLQVDAPSA